MLRKVGLVGTRERSGVVDRRRPWRPVVVVIPRDELFVVSTEIDKILIGLETHQPSDVTLVERMVDGFNGRSG